MIKDRRGRTPNFVVRDKTLLHQPTGLRVEITDTEPETLKKAIKALKEKIANAKSK